MASCKNAVGEEVVGVVGAVTVAAPEGINILVERVDIELGGLRVGHVVVDDLLDAQVVEESCRSPS
tara:strand:+ start:23445 stop:23642 length:198 start_codon:yes stop_codon:yes gene_type:complete